MALGLVAVVAVRLGLDVPTAVLAAASLLLLIRYKTNSALLILTGTDGGIAMATPR